MTAKKPSKNDSKTTLNLIPPKVMEKNAYVLRLENVQEKVAIDLDLKTGIAFFSIEGKPLCSAKFPKGLTRQALKNDKKAAK